MLSYLILPNLSFLIDKMNNLPHKIIDRVKYSDANILKHSAWHKVLNKYWLLNAN